MDESQRPSQLHGHGLWLVCVGRVPLYCYVLQTHECIEDMGPLELALSPVVPSNEKVFVRVGPKTHGMPLFVTSLGALEHFVGSQPMRTLSWAHRPVRSQGADRDLPSGTCLRTPVYAPHPQYVGPGYGPFPYTSQFAHTVVHGDREM